MPIGVFASMVSVQKVFKHDQRAKVSCGSDDAENDCQPIWWRDEDLWYFHGDVWFVLGRQFCVVPRTLSESGNLPCFILTNDFFLSDFEAVRQGNYKVERNVRFKAIEDLVELGDLGGCHCRSWLVGCASSG